MLDNRSALDATRDVALRSIAIIASGTETDFEEVFAPEAVNHESGNDPPTCRGKGPAAFHGTALWLRQAFEGLAHEVEHVAADADLVAIDTTMSGRHTGPFVLYDADGAIATVQAPTGRSFRVRQTHWFRVEDGRVAEHWAIRNDLDQALQLRWVPPTPVHVLRSMRAKRRALRVTGHR